jgi:hypothetical protein
MTPERSGRARPRPSGRRGPARRSEPARAGWTGRRTNWLRRRPDGPDLSARKKEGRPPRPTSREGGRQAVVPVAGQRRCLGPNRHPGPRPTQPRQRQQPRGTTGGTSPPTGPTTGARAELTGASAEPSGRKTGPVRPTTGPRRRAPFTNPAPGSAPGGERSAPAGEVPAAVHRPTEALGDRAQGPGGDLAGARPGGPGR